MADLNDFCGIDQLNAHANTYYKKIKMEKGVRPIALVGGQAMLNSKRPLNSIAAELQVTLLVGRART
jgi:hypothetical protein